MSNLSIYPEASRTLTLNSAPYTNNYVLVANVAQTITVPADYRVAAFSSTGNVYVNFLGVTADGAATTAGTGDEINPTIRRVVPGQTISVVAKVGCDLSVSFYAQE